MRKQIIIVGYAGDLQGVSADIKNYYDFFISPIGGMWHAQEISVLDKTSVAELKRYIQRYQAMQLDYFIFVFCGHGGSRNDEVVMEINDTDRFVRESEVVNVAPRQLNIFDCCRVEEDDNSYDLLTEMRTFSQGGKITLGDVRKRYDERILKAVPQSACLYACSLGESAMGNNSGGYYSYHLLKAARNIKNDDLYKTIGLCHNEACESLETISPRQHPDGKLPRCLTNRSLILSIHP